LFQFVSSSLVQKEPGTPPNRVRTCVAAGNRLQLTIFGSHELQLQWTFNGDIVQYP